MVFVLKHIRIRTGSIFYIPFCRREKLQNIVLVLETAQIICGYDWLCGFGDNFLYFLSCCFVNILNTASCSKSYFLGQVKLIVGDGRDVFVLVGNQVAVGIITVIIRIGGTVNKTINFSSRGGTIDYF
jgi:hypothetical protein